jgi:hypothetical protein
MPSPPSVDRDHQRVAEHRDVREGALRIEAGTLAPERRGVQRGQWRQRQGEVRDAGGIGDRREQQQRVDVQCATAAEWPTASVA